MLGRKPRGVFKANIEQSDQQSVVIPDFDGIRYSRDGRFAGFARGKSGRCEGSLGNPLATNDIERFTRSVLYRAAIYGDAPYHSNRPSRFTFLPLKKKHTSFAFIRAALRIGSFDKAKFISPVLATHLVMKPVTPPSPMSRATGQILMNPVEFNFPPSLLVVANPWQSRRTRDSSCYA